uniref:Uncharacterized protein n=1 Tax=Glossina brevipalpis TaxID=37001 RepID=A0A1A9W8L7_9MUSC
MTSCFCQHQIKILNLEDNELINHQFLLIKGYVESFKCIKNSAVSLQELNIANDKILTTGISQTNGQFKFLVDLGLNDSAFFFKFTYCLTSVTRSIQYQSLRGEFKISPFLVLAQDESTNEQTELNQSIVDLNLLLVQSVYADKVREAVQVRCTFELLEKCKIFRSQLSKQEIWNCTENDLWQSIAREFINSEWGKDKRSKFIAFINCTKYEGFEVEKSGNFSYANIRKHIKGYAALGGGGLALFGTIYFYCWPHYFHEVLNCFQNQQPVDLCKQPDDSNYRKTWAGVYASTLGALSHELGHIFDLGHTQNGVMGTGFDFINRVFTLNTTTEHLPQRIVAHEEKKEIPATRFTKFKKPANGFLDNYRQQKENDSFFFTNNCAIILTHNPWLKKDIQRDFLNSEFQVDYNVHTNTVQVQPAGPVLKCIEIRCSANSLVKEWYEFKNSATLTFTFPRLLNDLSGSHYIFVMSDKGHVKRLQF